jgi:hypothetical protein
MMQAPEFSFWPATVTGWATLVIAIGGVISGIVASVKFLATLDGFGRRLTDVEKAQEKAEGEHSAMQRQLDRVLNQHDSMISQLGEAKRSAEKCGEDTLESHTLIGNKVEELRREISTMNLNLSQRLIAVETVLKLKGET